MNFEFDDIKHLFKIKGTDENWREMLVINYIGGVKALNKLKLWEWIRTFQPKSGFCFSIDENVNKIMSETSDDGHSGASFGFMMRGLQKVACILIPEIECDKEICAICLEEDLDKKIVLDCGHKFHLLCISYIDTKCPLCRKHSIPEYLNVKETTVYLNRH